MYFMYDNCVNIYSWSDVFSIEKVLNSRVDGCLYGDIVNIYQFYYCLNDLCLYPTLVNDTYRLLTMDVFNLNLRKCYKK